MEFRDKAILVTGGAGFIGSHLCETLLKRGSRVICFDDLSQGKKANLLSFMDDKNFVFVQGDCNVRSDIETVFRDNRIDYIFHYAATVGVKRTTEHPLKVLRDINGIQNIFALAHKQSVKKVVFASSSEVYGEPVDVPEKEEGVLNAKIPYAQVKLIGESYVSAYWKEQQLPGVALRFFNVYGPRQESSDYGFVVGIFMRQVLEGKDPTVVGDGQMTRSFVYIEDNIEASLAALASTRTNGMAINIGSGETVTILELAQKVIDISGRKLAPVFIPHRNAHEINHRQPDLVRMHDLTEYQCRTSLEEGLRKTYNWYKDEYKK